jgi:glycosyltransferase involved in cell wall biosynthesis
MLPHLVKADIDPIIACLRRCGEEGVENEVLSRGFNVHFLNGKNLFAKAQTLRKLIRDRKPHIVHTALTNANLVGRIAAVGLPVVVISSLINTPYAAVRLKDPKIDARKLRVVQMFDGWTSRHLTTHFHAVSQAAKAAAINDLRVSSERITVVERGRDTTRLGQPSPERRKQARLRLSLQPDDQVMVNVGRQDYQKGQKYLLEAAAKLVKKRPKLVLLIAGRSGNVSPDLVRLKEQLRLNGQVRFLGHRQDIPEILAAADIFIFPSLFEGLPGAVIEAMALGLPIVASDIAPIREVVEENRNAILVAPASSSKLAEAVAALLDDPCQAMAYGNYSRKIFEARFTLQQSAARMIELYHQVAAFKNGEQIVV